MSEPMSPELEAATIAALNAETALHRTKVLTAEVEYEKAKYELQRTKFFVEEGEAEAERHRIYNFWGSVNDGSAAMAVKSLGEWSRMYPGEKMTIVFNSPGGGVISGLALFDYIKELQSIGHEIETVSIGYAASMGGVLLQSGDHRVMGANAYLLIHEVSSSGIGKTSELEDEVRFVKRLQAKLLTILAERSTLSEAEIARRWKRKDYWLDAQEALELGFIDSIR